MEKGNIADRHIIDFVSRDSENVTVGDASKADTEQLVNFTMDVYRDGFNALRFRDREEILKLWRWKYEANPALENRKSPTWIATYKGSLIGMFRAMPTIVKLGINYYTSAWGVDLAILRGYRNLGISAFIITLARKEAGKNFDLFLLGGMNRNSYNILKKTGFIDLGGIPRYVKILDAKTILDCYQIPAFVSTITEKGMIVFDNLIKTLMNSGNISIDISRDIDKEFDKFWNTVSPQYQCIARRDSSFLKWRYTNQPLWPYVILKVRRGSDMKGFAVIREGRLKSGRLKDKKIGVISDILVDPRDTVAIHRLLWEAIKIFKEKKAILLKCDILGNIGKNLYMAGFVRLVAKNGFMVDVYPKKDISAGDVKSAALRRNWYITSGDSDLDFE